MIFDFFLLLQVHLPGGSYPHTCCWGCQVMWMKPLLAPQTFLVKRAIWWQNYLVKKKPFLPIEMHTKNCTNLKIHLAAKDYQKLLGSSLAVTILFLRRPSTEVTCFDDIDQTRPVLPGPLTIHHLTVIWPFQPKKYLMTFSYPWAKVNILEYEMQHWNPTKLIFESLKSQ